MRNMLVNEESKESVLNLFEKILNIKINLTWQIHRLRESNKSNIIYLIYKSYH